MIQERSIPRYAHIEGHTSLCYSEDGEFIITCGNEGDIRIWKGVNDDDPTEKCVGEKALAVAQKADKLYVGSDCNNVQIYTFPKAELDGILTRFTAPVTTIDISKDGSFVAAGSADMEIHLINISNSEVKYFSGHKGAILHVAIDPKMEYLCSSSCDGSVRVWNLSDQKVVKEFTNIITPSNSFQYAETLCHVSWEPLTGRLLTIPIKSEIKAFQRSTWNVIMTFSENQASNKFSITAWSNCGRFLAASTTNGDVIVWNSLLNKIVSTSFDKNNLNICSLCWHPVKDKNELAYCDVNGQLIVINNCFPVQNLTSAFTEKTNGEGRKKLLPISEDFDSNDVVTFDEDDPEAISLEKIKSDYTSFLENSLDEKLNDDDSVSIKSSSTALPILQAPVIDLQPPFQPTSTPVHLQRRFMVFNDIGFVKQTNTEDENMIDVDFHDASVHHAFRINNVLNHTMAALNSEALVLACEKTDESSSKLVCRLFNAWDFTKEWNTEMMEDENIDAVTVANKWIAVATSFRFLRIFSLSGIQREIINLLGPVVCINAVEDLLIIVYHSAIGLPGEQNLHFILYKISSSVKVIVNSQALPLSPKATLKWIGFSDLRNPCMVDSNGILNLFVVRSNVWRPICSIDSQSKSLSNHHFVIGVSEALQNIRCIICKGSYYPSTTPHPFISEVPWQIPVCENLNDKGSLEEKFWRILMALNLLNTENPSISKELFATALKLFALSDQTNHEMRILEMCEFTSKKNLTEIALKYASKMRKNLLAEKLSDLRTNQMQSVMLDDQNISFNNRDDTSCLNKSGNNLSCNDNSGANNFSRSASNDYQSQELFQDCGSTLGCTNSNNQESVSLIAELRKQKSLSKQINQFIPSRKINPFKKQSYPNSSSFTEISSVASPSSLNIETTELNSKNNENCEKTPNQSFLKKRKCIEDGPSENNTEKKKSFSKLQGFAFKK